MLKGIKLFRQKSADRAIGETGFQWYSFTKFVGVPDFQTVT